jgi:hypothetical protein
MLTGGSGLSDLTEPVRAVFFLVDTRLTAGLAEETSGDGEGGVEEGEATAGCHGGGRGPSRPPWTGGRSGQRSSRREREAPWELGRLRRGRCEELEGR